MISTKKTFFVGNMFQDDFSTQDFFTLKKSESRLKLLNKI